MARDADTVIFRFRTEPFYGVFMQFGVDGDRTGMDSLEIEERCLEEGNVDALITRYQSANPLRPEDHAFILDRFVECLAPAEWLIKAMPPMATADDLTHATMSFFGSGRPQADVEKVIECSEEARYGPAVDFVAARQG